MNVSDDGSVLQCHCVCWLVLLQHYFGRCVSLAPFPCYSCCMALNYAETNGSKRVTVLVCVAAVTTGLSHPRSVFHFGVSTRNYYQFLRTHVCQQQHKKESTRGCCSAQQQ